MVIYMYLIIAGVIVVAFNIRHTFPIFMFSTLRCLDVFRFRGLQTPISQISDGGVRRTSVVHTRGGFPCFMFFVFTVSGGVILIFRVLCSIPSICHITDE